MPAWGWRVRRSGSARRFVGFVWVRFASARKLIGQALAPGGAGELSKISCPARSTLFELVASLFTQSVEFSCVAIGV